MEMLGLFLFLAAVVIGLAAVWGLVTGEAPRLRIENRTHALIALAAAGMLLYLSVQLVVPADPGNVGIW